MFDWRSCCKASLLALLFASPVAGFDLSRAEVSRLDNGLTLIVLEDQTFPVVSVQMLYRVGARHEEVGRTGMAHFLEHMAFRDTQNFPDTEVVSRIYAVGGEWHAYTWLDQTTYFETLPSEYLDLALRIEADRMARLLIPADQVDPERGAVLAEMHGYENDPSSVLHDAVLMMSFLQHPYRNNTIGWESDVESIQYADIVDFYERYYQPANAVLVVVGDISVPEVQQQVDVLFGPLAGGHRATPPPTVEPLQMGVRRLTYEGTAAQNTFKIAYRAPAVNDSDYVAFLVLQEVLAGGSGVNFSQNEWGDAVRSGARLDGTVEDLVTWFIPTAAPYVFTLGGSLDLTASSEETEARIEAALAGVRDRPIEPEELEAAKKHLLRELVFDVETTEDAAHQLAFFAGLDGLDVLLDLPARIAAVTAEDIQRVALTYLRPEQRTIGWYLAGRAVEPAEPRDPVMGSRNGWAPPAVEMDEPRSPSAPKVSRLGNGMPLVLQRVSLSPTAFLRILVPTTGVEFGGNARKDYPFWRQTSLDFRFENSELRETLQRARSILASGRPLEVAPATGELRDPESRLSAELDDVLGVHPLASGSEAAAVALVGDFDEATALAHVEEALGDVEVASIPSGPSLTLAERSRVVELDFAIAQAQLGYVVPAPPPSDPESWAWRMLLYVMSHGYEGRLGKEAISRQGLVYYIDSSYDSAGTQARVALKIGVDPGKLAPMRELLVESLDDLQRHPPTEQEVAEAKQHLLGRRQSSAQSNEEISAALLDEWVGEGRLLSSEEFAAVVSSVSRESVLEVIPRFIAGTIVEVRGHP
ncbi:MAG: insulinase family protein [Thermoanaerobaculia bacterium]|jgi:zinc protease